MSCVHGMDTTPVVIEDDDSVLEDQCEVIDNNSENESQNIEKANSFIDIIDLEEESSSNNSEPAPSNNEMVEENIESNNDDAENFAVLLKSNSLMNKIVQKCLKLGKNDGMARVITKTLLPLYKSALSNFKSSEFILKSLSRTLHNLKHNPNFKFSHIQSLCEILKQGKSKKRVSLITIAKDVHKPTPQTQPEEQQGEKVIDLDNSDVDKVITLNDDDTDNDDVMFVDETKHRDEKCEQSNKENCNFDKVNNIVTSTCKDVDNLLVPTNSVALKKYSIDFKKAMKIEKEIKDLKEKIDQLEQQEVTVDYVTSPYIQCDRYKARIVSLYKVLCKLTGHDGNNLMKQHVVRLQVAEGRHPGPAQILERFLNSTIDETGSVPLPDYHDVVECVKQSNITDNLGWSHQEIMQEALALFTFCGQALRKSRQKREYKDLMSLVHDKITDDDDDPANNDPELFARLEENKRIAKANENEIIERYAKLRKKPHVNCVTKSVASLSVESYSTDSASENEVHAAPPKRTKLMTVPNTNCHSNQTVSKTVKKVGPKINLQTDDTTTIIEGPNTYQNHFNQFIRATSSNGTLLICIDATKPRSEESKLMQQEETDNHNTILGSALSRCIISDSNLVLENNLNETQMPECGSNKTQIGENELYNNNAVVNRISRSDDKLISQEPFRQNALHLNNLSNLITLESALSSENNILINNETRTIRTEIIEFSSDDSQIFENNLNRTQAVENNLYQEFENGDSIEKFAITTSHSENEQISIKQEPLTQNTLQGISLSNLITFDSDPPTENQVIPLSSKSDLIKTEIIENDKNETQPFENYLNIAKKVDNNIFKESGNDNSVEDNEVTTPHSTNARTSNNQKEAFRQNTLQRINLSNLITFDSDLPTEKNSDLIKTESSLVEPLMTENDTIKIEDLENDLNKTQVENDNKELESNNSLENRDVASVSDTVSIKVEKDQIKQEPVDISRLLYNLGDNYFTTIYDIEDPFLVIEISSDSSSEDEL